MLRGSYCHQTHLLCRPRLAEVVLTSAIFLPALLASAQIGSVPHPAGSASASIPDLVAGRVVNALTGAPLPRALVQINGRAMLTDSEGRFRLEQPGQPVSGIRLLKPGFSMSPEQMDGFGDAVLDGPDPASLTLVLWPEALLAGTVTTSDGEALPRISVLVRRRIFDDQGQRFQTAGQKLTDSHGQFRIPLPAGDYLIETQFSASGFESGQAVLPVTFPAASSSDSRETLHLASGEEQHVELRPAISRTHVVTLPLEASDEGQPPQITARSSNGISFAMNISRSQEPGSVRLTLPTGSYSLHAMRYSRDGVQIGESTVTVPDHDISGPALHLTSPTNIPVEIVVDASVQQTSVPGSGSRSSAAPGILQFNLALQPIDVDPTSPFQFGIRPTQQRDSSATLAAPPGTYRLTAGIAGGWYIRSATSRGTNLLNENLVISPATSASPITLIVSNQTGALQGTVRLAGTPAACWIYLVATSPALPALIIRRTDSTGAFHLTDVPPGSYRAVAFAYRHSANLQDPAVLGRFSTHVANVSISAGNTASLDLDAVPAKELAQ